MKRLHQKKIERRVKTSRTCIARRSEATYYQDAISELLGALANSTHDLQPLFDAVLSNATRLCRAKIGTLRLREEQGFRLVSHIGRSSSIPTLLKPDDSPFAEVAETKSPVQRRDVQQHARFLRGDPRVVTAAKVAGIRTSLIVPLLKDEEIIGTIQIARTRVHPFTAKEIALVTAFAAQATIALDNSRRERQLRDLQMGLAHANRIAALGQLTASIVHEVKQPIAATITNAQVALRLLGSKSVDLAELRQIFTDIVSDGSRAAQVIETIRDLVQKAPAQKETFDINNAIQEVIVMTRGEAMRNGVSVQTQLTASLPRIEGDRVQMQQVVLNLVSNAIQAMGDLDEGVRELHISTGNTGSDGVHVAVRDTGPGLTPEGLQHLFEPFYTTKANGMGMGLSICRSIIENHGGRVWATDQHPRGTVFQFTVPAAPVVHAPP